MEQPIREPKGMKGVGHSLALNILDEPYAFILRLEVWGLSHNTQWQRFLIVKSN